MIKITTSSPEETYALGMKLGALLKSGNICTLTGDLGAGKTTFTRGLGKGLGVSRNINSPTFTIVKEYQGRMPFIHMDAYRLTDAEEDLGFAEYFYGEGVTVIEWPQKIAAQIPAERLEITIACESDTVRVFHLVPKGEVYQEICKELEV